MSNTLSTLGHFHSVADREARKPRTHTVMETFRQVFQDEPVVLEARTVKNVEHTRNNDGQDILNTWISVHYMGHADQPWPSWPWSKSPLMHTEMPPEMKGLYSEDLYREHLQQSNQILRRYIHTNAVHMENGIFCLGVCFRASFPNAVCHNEDTGHHGNEKIEETRKAVE
ncbi:hypothetical protein INT43_004353 [Umbelopsis isabellina]|uniref:Uncharacterized protein n=1 Tax=Mortierella isabellina TaxID=91625 RepID=A0A8H7PIC5_MORIS|nr:hypothetical protein INT43_004353 [Umbelopsis isabellina]